MDSKPKREKQKSSVRPCPQGCGFSLHDSDQHDACPVYLGIVHARRALTEPEACAFCRQFRRSTLERRVTFVEEVLGRSAVARHDPLSLPASAPQEDDDVLDIGLDIHGLSEDEQESSLSA